MLTVPYKHCYADPYYFYVVLLLPRYWYTTVINNGRRRTRGLAEASSEVFQSHSELLELLDLLGVTNASRNEVSEGSTGCLSSCNCYHTPQERWLQYQSSSGAV